ncbi:hypothetical protein [Cellvibrio sp.]
MAINIFLHSNKDKVLFEAQLQEVVGDFYDHFRRDFIVAPVVVTDEVSKEIAQEFGFSSLSNCIVYRNNKFTDHNESDAVAYLKNKLDDGNLLVLFENEKIM